MKDFIIEELNQIGKVSKREMDKYEKIDKNMMHFKFESYQIEGVGYLSLIQMKAMLGLMKMDTIIITPIDKDMPLMSYDYIHAMGNDTLLLELYNTCEEEPDLSSMLEVKNKYSSLSDHKLGTYWYENLKMEPTLTKKGKKQKDTYMCLAKEWIKSYLELLKNAKPTTNSIKKEKTVEYVDGLFEKGSPTVEQFVKLIGKEDAYYLYSKYVFSSKPNL